MQMDTNVIAAHE